MSRSNELAPDELQAYALALKLEATAFYLPPSEPFLTSLEGGNLFAEWPLAPDSPATARGIHLLRTTLASASPADLLPVLRGEYTALFVGLEQVDAPPWESVYLSRDHLLFDEQTLQVRDFYARFGLQIPKIDREPDDHIGYELLFLAHLLEHAASALVEANRAEAALFLTAARDFLVAHPQQWALLFAERVEHHGHTPYYRGFAYLLLGSLDALAVLLAGPAAGEGQA